MSDSILSDRLWQRIEPLQPRRLVGGGAVAVMATPVPEAADARGDERCHP